MNKLNDGKKQCCVHTTSIKATFYKSFSMEVEASNSEQMWMRGRGAVCVMGLRQS